MVQGARPTAQLDAKESFDTESSRSDTTTSSSSSSSSLAGSEGSKSAGLPRPAGGGASEPGARKANKWTARGSFAVGRAPHAQLSGKLGPHKRRRGEGRMTPLSCQVAAGGCPMTGKFQQ